MQASLSATTQPAISVREQWVYPGTIVGIAIFVLTQYIQGTVLLWVSGAIGFAAAIFLRRVVNHEFTTRFNLQPEGLQRFLVLTLVISSISIAGGFGIGITWYLGGIWDVVYASIYGLFFGNGIIAIWRLVNRERSANQSKQHRTRSGSTTSSVLNDFLFLVRNVLVRGTWGFVAMGLLALSSNPVDQIDISGLAAFLVTGGIAYYAGRQRKSSD